MKKIYNILITFACCVSFLVLIGDTEEYNKLNEVITIKTIAATTLIITAKKIEREIKE